MVVTSNAPSIVPTTATEPPERSVPAQHRSEKGRQQPIFAADRGHGGAEPGDDHHAGGRREQSRQNMADRHDAANRHSRHFGGARIGAGREHAPAETGKAVKDKQDRTDRHGYEEQRRQCAGDPQFAEGADFRGKAVERDRFCRDQHRAGK